MNISSALRQVAHGTRWHSKRKSYKVLFWREITPLAVPIFMENACVLLMGVLSTFLVSWLGKDAMAGVGLADSFNMVIMAFFAAIDLGTTVVVAFSLGKRDRRRARVATRQSLVIMTLFAVLLATLIHHFGEQIIDFVAGDATTDVKALALTYLELTVLSYPAAAITLIGSGALRGAGNTKIPLLINGSLNILNIISGILIYGLFSWPGLGFVGAGLGLTISRYIGAVAILWVLAIGFNPALRISLKSYFKPLNFSIIWEVMGIGIPASVESVLFTSGRLLTQRSLPGWGPALLPEILSRSQLRLLSTYPEVRSVLLLRSLQAEGWGRADSASRDSVAACVLAVHSWINGRSPSAMVPLLGYGTVLSGFHRLTRRCDSDWLNALFMPIWSASWVLPAGFKGARDARYAMWVSMLSMWGCRVVVGYVLGIMLGWGVVGVWMGMFADWAVRAVPFYWRMVTGRWLWKYPRSEPQKCEKKPVVSE